MMGGHTEEKTDAEGLAQCAAFKSTVEAHANTTYDLFEVTRYTTQVVAGTNYTFEAKVGDGKFITARVFVPLPCNEGANQVLEFNGAVEVGSALTF